MKNLLLVICFASIAQTTLFGQNGFYKNIFGDYNEGFSNAPLLNSINKLEDGTCFVTGLVDAPFVDYFSGTLLDSNFNTVWTSSYHKSGSNDFLKLAAQLDDNSIVSVGSYDSQTILVRHDAAGNLLGSNYYGNTQSIDFYTEALCKSTLNDTGYVALFSHCAVNFGLFKFNKNGDQVWAYEYGTSANIYELNQALDSGYAAIGAVADLSGDTTHSTGFVLIANDDGTYQKSKRFKHQDDNYNSMHLTRLITSTMDNSYYVACYYGSNHFPTPISFHKDVHILQLNSNLNIVKNFRVGSSDPDIKVAIDNMATSSDGNIVVNGRIRSSSSSYPADQYFIMKIDPNQANGQILWSKIFSSLSAPAHLSTYPVKGLYAYGAQNRILASIKSSDGAVLASIDANGEGLCSTETVELSIALSTDVIAIDNPLNPSTKFVEKFPVELLPYEESHTDTMLCATMTLDSSPIEEEKATKIIEISNDEGTIVIKNVSLETVDFMIYSITGKRIIETRLDASQTQVFQFSKGTYLFIAKDNNGHAQKDRFIIY